MNANECITAVRNHLTHYLGTPSRVLNIQTEGPELPFTSLEVAVFNENTEHPTILSTCGLSLNQILDGRRMELIFIIDNHYDDNIMSVLVELLGTLSVFSTSAVPPLNYGGMLGAREQLEGLTIMEGVIFFPPFMLVNDFHGFEAPDGSPIQFLWVVPIYEEEAAYAEDHGPRELANLVAANQLNLTDLQRPMANVEMSPKDVNHFLNPSSEESPSTNRRSPHEITPEQIAQFRDTNEVIINVGQRYKPKKPAAHRSPQAPVQSEPQAGQADSRPTPKRAPAEPSKQEPVRFNLETGERLNANDEVPVKQRPSPVRQHAANQKQSDPEEEKRKRVDALRKAAKAAKKRSEKPS